MTKFYTRSGDDGFTGLLGEERVPKYHPRPEAVGNLDEASAALGAARAIAQASETRHILLAAQRDLYSMMAEVAATLENAARFRTINAERVSWLESQIDSLAERVKLPNEFILPGDSPAGGQLAIARTAVRRAERIVAKLFHEGQVDNPELLRYLNRLSSLCFVLELLENQVRGKSSPTLAKV